ncbi:S1 RNA-binding domain-containing protein [Streptomyces sp. NBC_00873]|uniref:S1 RNA-binding domain-containing protein n=1 Tax=unclassified Streptomyces TaxID=2593676 RepID=UPI00386B378A|nr:S1 RNA-binding domain-containing protein [Streptomyces sp. NBC_00873]WTA48625.1 S1 RNA-binding domain-containing protein [Streptomyces sp. NBC_00842]
MDESPEDVIKVGDALTVMIIDVDVARRRIALSHTQARTAPLREIAIPDETAVETCKGQESKSGAETNELALHLASLSDPEAAVRRNAVGRAVTLADRVGGSSG